MGVGDGGGGGGGGGEGRRLHSGLAALAGRSESSKTVHGDGVGLWCCRDGSSPAPFVGKHGA